MQSDTATIDSPIGRREAKPGRPRRVPPLGEAAVWHPVRDGWQQLYGRFHESGVSIEWHEFELPYALDWSRGFHPDSLEVCLNVAGHGSIRCGESAVDFAPLTAGFYMPGKQGAQGRRHAAQRHRFLTVAFSRGFAREQLASCDGALHPLVEEFVRGDPPRTCFSEVHRLTAAQEERISHFLRPPVLQGARSLWFRGKVLEIMAEFFFERRGSDELFCDRQKRLARERAERVAAILRRHLEDPPGLEEIGREVGCSPFHLSRIFSAETGATIPQYLRKVRMERAAELLQTGKYNVTEAALEVGYSSLSHFSQAFCQTMGRCPGLYPLKTPPQLTAKEKQSAESAAP